jgi:hypothetical protein
MLDRFIRIIGSTPALFVSWLLDEGFFEKKFFYPRYVARINRHKNNLPILSDADREIVNNLKRSGIHITTLESLNFPRSIEMIAEANKLVDELKDISLLPSNRKSSSIVASSEQLIKYKELFDWGLNQRLLNIIENFIEMPVGYDGLRVFLNIANKKHSEAKTWHKDREDRKIIKILIYLNDVDKNDGPFEYLSADLDGKVNKSIARKYRGLSNSQIQRKLEDYKPKDITTVTGKALTILFANTARYHRGKPPTQSNRATIMFSYFSRTPWHPFFCQRNLRSSYDLTMLAKGLTSNQQACVFWKNSLPWIARLIPRSRI